MRMVTREPGARLIAKTRCGWAPINSHARIKIRRAVIRSRSGFRPIPNRDPRGLSPDINQHDVFVTNLCRERVGFALPFVISRVKPCCIDTVRKLAKGDGWPGGLEAVGTRVLSR